MSKSTGLMRNLIELCKRRGFLFQSAEIHGGLRGAYDYGPLGVELKRNLSEAWWSDMVYKKDNVVGVDTSIITPPGVFKASGHLESFTDALVDCKLSKERFRADKAPPITVIEKNGRKLLPIAAPDKAIAKNWEQEIQQLLPGITVNRQGKELTLPVIELQNPASVETAESNPGKILFEGKDATVELAYHGYVEPNSNSPFLTESRPFNLMFKTFLDPIDPIERVMTTTLAESKETDNVKQLRQSVDNELAGSTVFLRPETAQGVFVNFLTCQRTQKLRPPFGIAQIGKSFRNEIRLEHAIFRTPEFEQMELEYFVPPEEDSKWLSYWTEERFSWWKRFANHPENFRQRPHEKHELAHYAKGCVDVEYKFPWGWGEVEGWQIEGIMTLSNTRNILESVLTIVKTRRI
ncbi:hypothetical protein K7432_007122 [Basidiobolus ranarum]|uniref:Aminoacyl-transfer RNA synthetases class-II family profile domain-containing protein n=1 Tax=Basidiobolus ranarum TaxID=34480 RepID=A0ABR2WTX7_9FUNG